MSSTLPSAVQVEHYSGSLGRGPDFTISLTHRVHDEAPSEAERQLGFDLLDALLNECHFEQWND